MRFIKSSIMFILMLFLLSACSSSQTITSGSTEGETDLDYKLEVLQFKMESGQYTSDQIALEKKLYSGDNSVVRELINVLDNHSGYIISYENPAPPTEHEEEIGKLLSKYKETKIREIRAIKDYLETDNISNLEKSVKYGKDGIRIMEDMNNLTN